MARLLPFRAPERATKQRQPRLVELDESVADDVFAALSSETARAVLQRLYEEPAPASEVAESVETSLQNARYHLEKLMAAELIEEVDTWYSSRGTEMTVYAPTNEPLVIAAGPDESTGVLREAVARLTGAVGLLAVASLLVDRWVRSRLDRFVPEGTALGADRPEAAAAPPEAGGGGDGGGGAVSPTPEPAPSPTPGATEQAERLVETASQTPVGLDSGLLEAVLGVPPGAIFFAGGLLVLVLIAGWWYLRRYRPLYGSVGRAR